MGNTKAREARGREAREAEAREARAIEAREAQNREARVREAAPLWKVSRVGMVLGSIGAALLGLKLTLFVLLPIVVFLLPGQDLQLVGMVGMILGSLGAEVLGVVYWVLSWIVPIFGFIYLENRKLVLRDRQNLVLLGVERAVVIVGVMILGLEWALAFDLALVVVVTTMLELDDSHDVGDSLAMGVKLAVAVWIGGMMVLGLRWGMVWLIAIVVIVVAVTLPLLFAYDLQTLITGVILMLLVLEE